MRKYILILTLLQCVVGTALAADTLTVRIKGMRCEECAHNVMKAVRQEKGIISLACNIERRTTTIVFDPTLTSADSIKSRLVATKRYMPTEYSPTDTIKRGFGLRMDDMHCQNCADRIVKQLGKLEGIDSLAPHIDKHYVFIRYDANRTCKDSIRKVLVNTGYTPVNYYTGNKTAYAYFNIPAEAATQETLDEVIIIDGVEDVNVNPHRNSLAVTYFTEETTAEKLLEDIRKTGIDAQVPAPHECKEKE